MTLTVWLPSEVLLEEQAVRIKAQGVDGSFGLLPKHIDFVAPLAPGVLAFQAPGKPEEYVAVDHGILVKCGAQVRISTRNAVRGTNLPDLAKEVEKRFRQQEELEKKARALEAKLETDLVRRLLEEERRV